MSDKRFILELTATEYEYLRGVVALGAACHDVSRDKSTDAEQNFARAAEALAVCLTDAERRLGRGGVGRLIKRFFDEGEAMFGNQLAWRTQTGEVGEPMPPSDPNGVLFPRSPRRVQ